MKTITKQDWEDYRIHYPKAIEHFLAWVDQYKKDHKWEDLFNQGIRETYTMEEGKDITFKHAPKYHDLPIAMQFGIFLEYFYAFMNERSLTVADLGITTPNFEIGVQDSITRLLGLIEGFI